MKQPFKHDYSGSCGPGSSFNMSAYTQETFSVGIFQWLPKSSKNGLKKSSVKVRVSGKVSDPDKVYAKAEEICKQLDAGSYTGPKNVRARE